MSDLVTNLRLDYHMLKPAHLVLTVIAPIICTLCAFADADIQEQAFVEIDIAWCMEPGCHKDGLWRLNRSPDCVYQKRFGVIRAVCDLWVEKDWRNSDNWTIILSGPKPSFEDNDTDQYHFFYLHKMTFDDRPPMYSISWNADLEGKPVYDHAQWNLGEDYSYSKHPEKDIHTIEGHESKIVINFECSLLKYPEPETTSWREYYKDAVTNYDMLFRTTELISLQEARIRQLMKLKIEQIRDDDYNTDEYIETMVKRAIEVQEAWEEYATARYREVAASYGRGSGAPLGGSSAYFDLQVDRIKDLLVVYK